MNTIIAHYRGIPITREMCFKGFRLNGIECVMHSSGPIVNPELNNILKQLPPNPVYELATRFHYATYKIGGTIYDRQNADEMFLIIMHKIINKAFKGWWLFPRRWWLNTKLYNNFEFIRNMGLRYFNHHVLPVNKISIKTI